VTADGEANIGMVVVFVYCAGSRPKVAAGVSRPLVWPAPAPECGWPILDRHLSLMAGISGGFVVDAALS